MCPSQALQGGGCVSDFLHSQSPREPPRTHCFRPLAPPNTPHHTLSKACSLAPDPSIHFLNKNICDIIIIVPFCPELSFTCRVDLLSANIQNISMLRGSWDKVSRVEEIKIIYQSQQLEGYKYRTCTMGQKSVAKQKFYKYSREIFSIPCALENGPTAPYTAPAALKVRQPIRGTHLLP